jgi:hypothetical protein
MEEPTPPIRSPQGRGIFGAVVAHFAVVLFILMFSFGATIEGLYKLWLTLLPVPIIVGIIAGLLNGVLQNLVSKGFSFTLAGVTILIAYPVSSLIVDVLILDLNIVPEPFSYSILFFGIGYLLTGIVIEIVFTGLIIVTCSVWKWISRFFP